MLPIFFFWTIVFVLLFHSFVDFEQRDIDELVSRLYIIESSWFRLFFRCNIGVEYSFHMSQISSGHLSCMQTCDLDWRSNTLVHAYD